MLRSIIATFRFRARVAQLKQEGADFTKYLYVPEVDPITNREHHEREDHNHMLKRMVKHTGDGGLDDINVRRVEEAMGSKDTDLTYAALVGLRKQSVSDAEKLLSHAVAQFFKSKGYESEAQYVKVVADWH
ncbi:hypothetical protein Bbelb_278250 [Branchiostoma belcheri]|nr:hypothetical protein Bbelb_278250 [Branchiostoma belcheri]